MKRPIMRYHGGKYMIAPWIISHLPAHRVYVELFGGAASVLLKKGRSYGEVYNDKWDLVVNVFRVMRNPEDAKKLEQLCRLTPFSRTEFLQCSSENIASIPDPVERARLTIYRSFTGFGSAAVNGNYATGFRSVCRRSGSTPAMDWYNFPSHIPEFVERLRGVVIENKDYRDVIDQQDDVTTLFYVDPPYMHDTRNMRRGNAAYHHEMDESGHIDLLRQLHQVKGMVVLSGYANPLYEEHIAGTWKCYRKSTIADGAGKRIECLWLNERAQEQSSALRF